MKYIFQYSFSSEKRIAISDWIENTRIIEAESLTEAINKGNKYCSNLGTWMVMDCWPASAYDINFFNK